MGIAEQKQEVAWRRFMDGLDKHSGAVVENNPATELKVKPWGENHYMAKCPVTEVFAYAESREKAIEELKLKIDQYFEEKTEEVV